MRFLTAALLGLLVVSCATAGAPPPDAVPQPTAAATETAAPAVTSANAAAASTSAAPEGPACKGHVDPAPAGLVPSEEAAPSFSIGAPGKGALCEGKVFTVKEPITVYRVFTAKYETAKKAGPTGAYWTLAKPSGKLADYRSNYEICSEWNDLDMLNECKVDVGAKVVLGPGQSADCDSGAKYEQSAANQLLIVKGADGKVPVSGCKQSPMAWDK